jgi:hypothetical protein
VPKSFKYSSKFSVSSIFDRFSYILKIVHTYVFREAMKPVNSVYGIGSISGQNNGICDCVMQLEQSCLRYFYLLYSGCIKPKLNRTVNCTVHG